MTASRIIDSHLELDDIGQLTHDQLDTYITGSTFLVVSGSGPLPPSARRLKAGAGISIIDEGPGGHLIISSTPTTGSAISWSEIPSGAVDGANVTFNLLHTPVPLSALMFYVNGVLQDQGAGNDYALSGSTITMLYATRVGNKVVATYPY